MELVRDYDSDASGASDADGSVGSGGGGNTKPPPQKKSKKEPRCSAALRWCFTWNNYPDGAIGSMAPLFQRMGMTFIMSYEVGESGTPHVQGFVRHAKTKFRPVEKFKLPKEIHWEAAKGTDDQNYVYCSKDGGDVTTNMPKPKIDMTIAEDDIIPLESLFPWGQDLVKTVAGTLPGMRSRGIKWIWSEQGCMKKTETARYLAYHHHACIIQGGRKHVLATAYKNPAPIYILLVPRTDEGFVSYASIELLKDSLYMSAFGTEATGSVNRKKPWVIVFANFEPEAEKLSEDRWETQNVDPA